MPSHSVRQGASPREFGELREALRALGESERAFALRIGIDKSTFNRLVNGQVTQFDLGMIEKIGKGTGGAIGHEAFAVFGKRLAENPLPTRKPARRRKAA